MCSTSFHQKFVSDSSRRPATSGTTSAASEAHLGRPVTTTPLNTNPLKEVYFHDLLPKRRSVELDCATVMITTFHTSGHPQHISRRQPIWLDSSVMRPSCSPCNWAVGKINAALSPLSDTAESQGLTLRDLLSFPEPAANPRLLVMIPMVPPQSADVIPAGDQSPSTCNQIVIISTSNRPIAGASAGLRCGHRGR